MKSKFLSKADNPSEEIFEFAQQGRLEEVRSTLLKGVDVDVKNPKAKFQGLLHIAAQAKNIALLEMLLKFEPAIDLEDEEGSTPLFYAIESKCETTVRFFLEHGANPNHRDKISSNPIYWAVYSSTIEVLKLLKRFGANLHLENRMNRTALTKAAFLCKHQVVQWLLEDANIIKNLDAQDERGRTAAHTACWGRSGGRHCKNIDGVWMDDSPESLAALLDKGANVASRSPSRTSQTQTATCRSTSRAPLRECRRSRSGTSAAGTSTSRTPTASLRSFCAADTTTRTPSDSSKRSASTSSRRTRRGCTPSSTA
jgi:ankyrin repeat protein